MGSLGIPELVLILLILVVLFGAGKLPELGKGLGKAISNFKSGLKDGQEDQDQKKLGSSAQEKDRQ